MDDGDDDLPSTVCIEVMVAVVERIPWRFGFAQLALFAAAVCLALWCLARPAPRGKSAGPKVAPEVVVRAVPPRAPPGPRPPFGAP